MRSAEEVVGWVVRVGRGDEAAAAAEEEGWDVESGGDGTFDRWVVGGMARGGGGRREGDWKVDRIGVDGSEASSVERWMLERRVDRKAGEMFSQIFFLFSFFLSTGEERAGKKERTGTVSVGRNTISDLDDLPQIPAGQGVEIGDAEMGEMARRHHDDDDGILIGKKVGWGSPL